MRTHRLRAYRSELCNGVEDDCNAETGSPEQDLDGDGFMDCDGDCDDTDPGVFPGTLDTCEEGLDQDCDATEGGEFDDPKCWAAAFAGIRGRVPYAY